MSLVLSEKELSEIRRRASYWSTADCFDLETRKRVDRLLSAAPGSTEAIELIDSFYSDLEFGTAGLRGILGPGTNRMNVYNVRRAAFALGSYLVDLAEGQTIRVGITYDSRRFSKEFSETVAECLASLGIECLLTHRLQPVPLLSFMVREWKCTAGVAVTASHNPPAYNGIKVYWSWGGQIVPPHDAEVMKRYQKMQDYSVTPSSRFSDALAAGKIRYVGPELEARYLEKLVGLRLRDAGKSAFKIVFTPLHGTTGDIVPEALSRFGFSDVQVVEAQRAPDSEFRTVKSPNPEDASSLELALQHATRVGADLVLATDPDGDRIGILWKDGTGYRFVDGNDIGTLLVDYVLGSMAELKKLPPYPLVIKSITTTPLQSLVAEGYGAHVDETLTGFKWIAAVIEDYVHGRRLPAREFVCGGEESFGFLAGNFVRDKDGISACCIAAEAFSYFKSKGMTADDVLDSIYRKHGMFVERVDTLVKPGKTGAMEIQAIMNGLRSQPPRMIAGLNVVNVRDFQTLAEYKVSGDLWRESRLDFPRSNVLQFYLEDGSRVSVRPSGTEPKIKFYFSIREGKGGESDLESMRETAERKLERVRDAMRKG